MALNRLMHADNVYKTKQPNFLDMALKWPEFAKFVSMDVTNKPKLDYSNPEALRQLTMILLKQDFDLTVELPLNRLVPTLPLRINYLLWLGDIFEKKRNLFGLDIGSGASCIYSLLGNKMFDWKFEAIESDEINFEYACKNVATNNKSEVINLKKVNNETELSQVMNGNPDIKFDFCMCNPPFYANPEEHNKCRTTRRPKPQGANTADLVESVTPGGEIEFVKKIISSSLQIKDRVRVYTTMLGKKSSLSPLRKALLETGVPRIGHTEFCQGRTMRWGLAWSFDTSIQFPKSTLEQYHAMRATPLKLTMSSETCCLPQCSIEDVQNEIIRLFNDLGEITVELVRSASNCRVFVFKATAANWTNQRAKRRAAARLAKCQQMAASAFTESDDNKIGDEKSDKPESMNVDDEKISNLKRLHEETQWIHNEGSNSSEEDVEMKRLKCDLENENDSESTAALGRTPTPSDGKRAILKCYLGLKLMPDKSVLLEFNFISGDNKESMHQVYQFLKNRLTKTKSTSPAMDQEAQGGSVKVEN